MKISKLLIIHPSRGRPVMARENANQLIDNRSTNIPFRYILSLDRDDPRLQEYLNDLGLHFQTARMVEDNASVIPAVNRAAERLADEDLIFNMSDDIASTPGWDERLIRFINGIPSEQYLVQPVDMDNGSRIPVIQIMSAALYRSLGYVLPPMYFSMFADDDLIETCRRLNVVYPCSTLGFDHRHPCWGKGEWDDTYRRENAPEAYASGLEIFNRRRSENFGIA